MTDYDPRPGINSMIEQMNAEMKRLKKENKKLRVALAPFACLGRNELRPGDFNRARRAIQEPVDK